MKQVFVAREQELLRLRTFLANAAGGRGQVAFVAGEAGSGKTALVREFALRAQEDDPDLIVAMGTCTAYTGLGDAFLPFREVLQLLTGDPEGLPPNTLNPENANRLSKLLNRSIQLLVEVGPDLLGALIPGGALLGSVGKAAAEKLGLLTQVEALLERKEKTPSDDAKMEPKRIFEQYTSVVRALAKEHPLLLILDDLQWADPSSISLLFHLGRALNERQGRVLLLGIYRPDEIAAGRASERHPLEKVIHEFTRYFENVTLDLERVQETESEHFINAFLDTEPNLIGQKFRQKLLRHTGGHPLFTVELLRAMQERGDLIKDEQGQWVEGPTLDWERMPPKVEGVIEERISRLAEELRRVLSAASVQGQVFTAQLIARVEGLEERQLLRDLSEELENRHRLVKELKVNHSPLSDYQFAHTLIQRYLYQELGAAQRQKMHAEVACWLEELYADRIEEILVPLAHHYAIAGEQGKAVEYFIRVGDKARALYANQEAVDAYSKAVSFLKEQGDYERAARTMMKLGWTYHAAFMFAQERQAITEANRLWLLVDMTSFSPKPGATRLRVASPDVETLDPAAANDIGSGNVIDPLFSGLLERGAEMEVVPEVARKWEMLDEGRTYKFHLHDDFFWSDGMPITATDFEYAWKRVLDPATNSPNGSQLYEIKNARAFHEGEIADAAQVGVRALDARTLVVELEGPISYFPHLLAYHASYAVPKHIVEKYGQTWAEPEHIVTNGPFRLERWQRGQVMTLSRNPAYRGRFPGNVEHLEISLIADPDARLELYEKGELDILPLWSTPTRMVERIRQRHAGEYISAPELTTDYIGFNVRQPPFDNREIRQAFAQAIDIETLANTTRKGSLFPATGGFVPLGMAGHSAGIGVKYDPDRARRLLADAGYPQGRNFPELKALSTDDRRPMAEYLQTQWEEVLGVKIRWELEKWTGRGITDTLLTMPPPIFMAGWLADYPDPDNFLRVCPFRLTTGWQNNTFEELVEQATRVMDQEVRMQLYRQAETILMQDAAIVPITYGRRHWLVKPWVKQFRTSPIYWWFWQNIIIEPH
ncbi:MAG TPA: ABC transporter substrate-binding protein [Pyrinomonadaceae bacterium]|nr:ABC transporter substrate-binding protein [Pyrinomonadaceae bacterium]